MNDDTPRLDLEKLTDEEIRQIDEELGAIDWGDTNWRNIVATDNAMSTSAVTWDSLKEAMCKAAELPRPEFDVVVMTDEVYQQAKKRLGTDLPWVETTVFDSFMGMPLEVCPTKAKAMARASELIRDGKRPYVCVAEHAEGGLNNGGQSAEQCGAR